MPNMNTTRRGKNSGNNGQSSNGNGESQKQYSNNAFVVAGFINEVQMLEAKVSETDHCYLRVRFGTVAGETAEGETHREYPEALYGLGPHRARLMNIFDSQEMKDDRVVHAHSGEPVTAVIRSVQNFPWSTDESVGVNTRGFLEDLRDGTDYQVSLAPRPAAARSNGNGNGKSS